MKATTAAVICLYLLLMGLVTLGMFRARSWSQQTMDGVAAESDWQEFRDDVVVMNETSSVQRRVPKSVEPPARVLMRDHFFACTAIALVLSSALYATCAFFVVGVLRNEQSPDTRQEFGD